jgi:Domain of unknown function (DUF6429)
MDLDTEKIDETVLALLYLTVHDDRAWKSFDWDTMSRLHEKGFISNPVGKAKSVRLTDEGCGNPNAYLQSFLSRNSGSKLFFRRSI